ncbi:MULTISPECIES: SDR family NAD(P)-dependent oxidoreductase [Streptomyces]|uniref:Cis-2,3-dihydrobiphenyl-2,3-diol dehydrogenase n=1 Tax=Streptomyces viridochromogenes TaxID=1938 RepID=A0A0L8K9I1_STRVR|nr:MULTISPECIES: SDR family NAD(P)-dependent oxidoreductase [Streptomyces]KOG22565.1 cis-2,3-dihydrobiphenyl-2,3-diol dehydrogenase [Streptomyces viridochromogenes]
MNETLNDRTHSRTWLITGASSGIGRHLVLQALENGDTVAALARDTSALDELAPSHGERLLLINTDVRDERAVRDAVQGALARFGRIDVVANNAGYGLFGAVEEASDTQVRAVFDTNVFGVLNVLRATLPVLRAQRSGHILQGSSVYGQSAHPGVGLLAATKHAVEGLSEALAAEVAPLGIKVTLIQPGLTATPFLANLDVAAGLDDYDQTVREVQKAIGELPATAFSAAARIAEGIRTAVDNPNLPLRLALDAPGATNMRDALEARIADLDNWQHVTEAVDGQ